MNDRTSSRVSWKWKITLTIDGGTEMPLPTKKPTLSPAAMIAVLVPGPWAEALRPQVRSVESGSVLG